MAILDTTVVSVAQRTFIREFQTTQAVVAWTMTAYTTDHSLIDLHLFNNRVLTLANATMFLFAIAFFGAGLLFPSYFQQLLGQTPLQSGVY